MAGSKEIDETLKSVITEDDVRAVSDGGVLLVCEEAVITPLAMDMLASRGIELKRQKRGGKPGSRKIIGLGADHGGYETKEKLKPLLEKLGYQFRDFGTDSSEAVDYPDFAYAVARAVADGACELGIVLDGAGIGSCMTANKVPGIRAAMCYDAASARNSREHNYANVLTLGAKMLNFAKIQETVEAWLATDYGEARHGRRVAKIMNIEKQYSK